MTLSATFKAKRLDPQTALPSLLAATPQTGRLGASIVNAKLAPFTHPAAFLSRSLAATRTRSLDEQLFDARATCKITTRQFAMLFDADWQQRFFDQLDRLMDAEEWDAADLPVTADSFRTLIRLLLILRRRRRPGLAIANDGHIVATWSTDPHNRLTIECLPGDRVRWLVTVPLDDGPESAAGDTMLERLLANLQPYSPEHWFQHEGRQSP